jgi:hypothetical protein
MQFGRNFSEISDMTCNFHIAIKIWFNIWEIRMLTSAEIVKSQNGIIYSDSFLVSLE